MGKTKKGGKSNGYEFWSRRPIKAGTTPSKKTKQITHRLERRIAKKEDLLNILENEDDEIVDLEQKNL